jgi:DNA-binding GntR family transcriptional regulator
LADAGYLVIRRGRYGGTFVADQIPESAVVLGRDGELREQETLTAQEIDDVLIYRTVIETGAAFQAAQTDLSAESRDALWQAHLDTKASTSEDYRRLDSRLHLMIAEVTGSNALVNQVAQSRMKINELLNNFPLLAPNIAHSSQQHEEIVMAILTGQAQKASDAMRAHLEGSSALIHGFLD